jgi:hypothetical protein
MPFLRDCRVTRVISGVTDLLVGMLRTEMQSAHLAAAAILAKLAANPQYRKTIVAAGGVDALRKLLQSTIATSMVVRNALRQLGVREDEK